MSRKRRPAGLTVDAKGATPTEGDWLWLDALEMKLTGSSASGLRAESCDFTGKSPLLNLGINKLEVVASPFHCLEAPIHLELGADDVRLAASETDGVRSFSVDLKQGRLILEIDRTDLAGLVQKLASEALRSEGIKVSSVELQFESLGPRKLRIQARLTAQKAFVWATLDAAGLLVINDALQARLADFRLHGDGVIASFIARLLRPQLESLAQQELALGASVLGCFSLTDLEFQAAETLRIVARFGAAQPGAPVPSPPAAALISRDPRPQEIDQAKRQAVGASFRRFHIYIIDTGWNKESRRLLDENRARYAAYLDQHVVCELSPGQSDELIRAHPSLVGADPILMAVDRRAVAEKQPAGWGFRYNMGAVADREQAQKMLRRLLKILGEQHQVADVAAAVRKHARREGFRGTIDILDDTLTGIGAP